MNGPQIKRDARTGLSWWDPYSHDAVSLVVEAQGLQSPCALVVSDIDQFTEVNNDHGRRVGNAALRLVAAIANNVVQQRGQVYRNNGDQIVFLFPHMTSLEARKIAELFREAVQQLRIEESKVSLTLSAGVAECPLHANNPKDLFRRACRAMREAKEAGRNRVSVFTPGTSVGETVGAPKGEAK